MKYADSLLTAAVSNLTLTVAWKRRIAIREIAWTSLNTPKQKNKVRVPCGPLCLALNLDRDPVPPIDEDVGLVPLRRPLGIRSCVVLLYACLVDRWL